MDYVVNTIFDDTMKAGFLLLLFSIMFYFNIKQRLQV